MLPSVHQFSGRSPLSSVLCSWNILYPSTVHCCSFLSYIFICYFVSMLLFLTLRRKSLFNDINNYFFVCEWVLYKNGRVVSTMTQQLVRAYNNMAIQRFRKVPSLSNSPPHCVRHLNTCPQCLSTILYCIHLQ